MTKIEIVKQKSILEVAESLGYPFKHLSGQIYEHLEHDSFRIFAETNTFKWFSKDIQGDVIDFVQLVEGVSFKEAITYLETGDFNHVNVLEETYHPFRYYLREESFEQSRKYLNTIRGISNETINFFGRQGLLAQAHYKTQNYHEPILVFKSLNHKGQIEGASLQGIIKDETRYDRGYLKKIMKGSHGYVGVSVDIGKPKKLAFCESVIDMMSFYQIHQKSLTDIRLISMEGLKVSVVSYHLLRLAAEEQGKLDFLDTVQPNRLPHYLHALIETTTFFKNHEGLLTLAVDNDRAGKDFCQKLLDLGLPVKMELPKLQGLETKVDWNDQLRFLNKNVEIQELERPSRQLLSNIPYSSPGKILEM